MFRDLPDPCMVLFEDIDALNAATTERGSSKKRYSPRLGPTNLAGLLNLLDGVAWKEGLLLFMTTNYLKVLDEAMTRPGRINKQVEFTYAISIELHNIFVNIYSSDANIPATNNDELDKLAKYSGSVLPSNKLTVAEVQRYLFRHKDDPQGALAGAAAWSKQYTLNPKAK